MIFWLPLSAGFGSAHAADTGLEKEKIRAIEERFDQRSGDSLRFTLEGYLHYAALNNPGLRAAFYKWKSALERVAAANSLPNPQLTYSYFLESVETRVGPQNFKIALRQTIPWFGSLGAGAEASFREAEAAYQEFQSEKLQLFLNVRSAYYSYYLLARQIQITSDNLLLLKAWEEILTARYEVSLSDHPDLTRIQLERGRLENDLISLQKMRRPERARLLSLIGLSNDIELPLPDTLDVEVPDLDFESLKHEMLSDNPDLRSLQKRLNAREATLRLAHRSSYPSITLGLGYISTGPAVSSLVDESGKDPWEVSVGLSLPIWFNKDKARRAKAAAGLRQAEYQLIDARNALTARLERVVFEYQDAAREKELFGSGLVPLAEQSLSAAYASYQAGESDFLSLIDAQRQLLTLQLEYETALTVGAVKLAEIEMLTGKEQI